MNSTVFFLASPGWSQKCFAQSPCFQNNIFLSNPLDEGFSSIWVWSLTSGGTSEKNRQHTWYLEGMRIIDISLSSLPNLLQNLFLLMAEEDMIIFLNLDALVCLNWFFGIQPPNFAYIRLLNKPYENKVERVKTCLKFKQPLELFTYLWKG